MPRPDAHLIGYDEALTQAKQDWPREAAELEKAGLEKRNDAYTTAWIAQRAMDLAGRDRAIFALEPLAAALFGNLTTDHCWDAADFREVSRAGLRHMLEAAYAAGAQAAQERTRQATEALTAAADAIRRDINGGTPVPAATTERRIRSAIKSLQDVR